MALNSKNHTEKVVMFLMRNFLNNEHSVYMDNFYNSCSLVKNLLSHNTFCTGTLRQNSTGNPPEIVKAKFKTVNPKVCSSKMLWWANGETRMVFGIY